MKAIIEFDSMGYFLTIECISGHGYAFISLADGKPCYELLHYDQSFKDWRNLIKKTIIWEGKKRGHL